MEVSITVLMFAVFCSGFNFGAMFTALLDDWQDEKLRKVRGDE